MLSKSSPIISSSSVPSSTCSTCFLSLWTALSVKSETWIVPSAISLKDITVFLSLSLSRVGSNPEFNWTAVQLNSGLEPTLDRDNDKNTVISLREIAEGTIQVSDLTDSAVHKLRKHVEQVDDGTDDDEIIGDDFESMYKGEISKSGTPILPSKRARKIPEKIQVSSDDLEELTAKAEPEVDVDAELEAGDEETAVSLDQLAESETTEDSSEETEPNS